MNLSTSFREVRLVWRCRLFDYSTYMLFWVHWHGGQCLQRLVPNYALVFRLLEKIVLERKKESMCPAWISQLAAESLGGGIDLRKEIDLWLLQVLPLKVTVDLGVMIMKEYSALLRSLELGLHCQMQLNVVPWTSILFFIFWGGANPSEGDVVSIF